MRISWNWLSDYIQSELDVNQTAEILTSIGLEVEMVEPVFSHPGGLKGLVIGEVIECEKHPNADKLSKTKVNLGDALGIVPIVCGAPNVRKGQKVIVATVGTTLYPTSGNSFEIKSAKIRGEDSQGMICAEDEIGLGTSHDGIIVLPDSSKVGTSAAEYYNVSEDFAIEIGLTPNRSDAMSHLGVARDLHAAFTARNIRHTFSPEGANWPAAPISKEKLPIQISVSSKNCSKYLAQTFYISQSAKTPKWILDRLATIGVADIHPVVNCSNYILHDIGHPTHCFDYQSIKAGKLKITDLTEPQKFSTLAGGEIELQAGDLCISDAEKPLCLAGIIGSNNSGVTSSTTQIVLECAYFLPTTIRTTSQRLGIKTESSQKYEKGVDPNATEWAIGRMQKLLGLAAGAKVASEIVSTVHQTYPPFEVEFSLELLYQYIGRKVEENQVLDILKSLEIKILDKKNSHLKLAVPQYRFDVRRPEDVVEDIMRILSYDIVPYPEHLRSNITFQNGKSMPQLQENIAQNLSGEGFVEIMTNSIASSKIYTQAETIPLLNSMTSELDCLRTDMIVGFLETAAYNINRDQKDLQLFEMGNVYAQIEGKYTQKPRLALLSTGYAQQPFWLSPKGTKSSYYTLLNSMSKLLMRYFGSYELKEIEAEGYQYCVEMYCQNTPMGKVGQIDKKWAKKMDIKQEVYFGEIYLDVMHTAINNKKIRYKEIPKFPSIKRDLALLVPKSVRFGDIATLAKKTHKELLTDCYLFDVFTDEKLGNMKSYAVRFSFQHAEKTFEFKEIDQMMQKLIEVFKNQLNASLR